MLSSQLEYALLGASTLLMILLLIILLKINRKSQLHQTFIAFISLLIIWNTGAGLDKWWMELFGYANMYFVAIIFIGTCFLPVAFLLTGIIFAKTKINLTYNYLLLLVTPVISTLILWTNKYHNLFFVNYSYISSDVIYGRYFFIHAIYSYVCLLMGMYYLLYFSIKNSGIFSKQSIVIIIGSFIPLIVNIAFTLNIINLSLLATPITFSFAILCYFIAIIKYDFLGVSPIAMQTVVDRISDSFIVIDAKYRIVDYNKTMIDKFGKVVSFKRKDNLFDVLKSFSTIDAEMLKNIVDEVTATKKSYFIERHFKSYDFDKYFTIEITPIISKDIHLGNIILLKDITEHKLNLKKIEDQQEQIIEQERLASLGTLIGGISHNLKTPIMSMSGCIIALEDLAKEYDESIGNSFVTEDDHHEIAAEMLGNLKELKEHVSYISNAMSAIKNQVASSDARKKESFTLEEVTLSIEFLLKYELKSNFCILNIINDAGKDCRLQGDAGAFVQILNNLVSNSIQAYDKITDVSNININLRSIELIIKKDDKHIIFEVKDYAKGISQEIKDKLFKEMVTTKGREGSGIGLYLSFSKVKVMFNGEMWFDSAEGKGTSFYVKIPQFSSQLIA